MLKRTTLLYILLSSLFVGQLIHFKIASLYHFIVLLFSILFFCTDNKTIMKTYKDNSFLRFFAIWFLYSLFSIFWSEDAVLSLQYTYYILLIFLVVYIISLNVHNDKVMLSVIRFVIFLTTVVCIVSLYETTTGNHIMPNYLSTPIRERILKYFPSFSFQNPNDFAMFIFVVSPYSFWGVLYSKSSKYSTLSIFNLVSSIYLIAAAQSRTILIVYLAYVFVIALKNFKKSILPLVIGLLCVSVVLYFYVDMNAVFDDALYSITFGEMSSSITTVGGSGNIRVNLFLNCILILIFSFGMGVGAGCHRVVMPIYSYNYFPTGHVRVAHNFVAEFLADYGIIMFLKFAIEYVKAMKVLKLIRAVEKNSVLSKFSSLLFWWMIFFPVAAITSSSLIQLTVLWINFGIIAAQINIHNNYVNKEMEG